jgi:hypothetical protein
MSSYVKVRIRSRQLSVKESGLGARKGESIGIFLDNVSKANRSCNGSTGPVSTDFEAEKDPQEEAERNID